jgi:hypothetical protein
MLSCHKVDSRFAGFRRSTGPGHLIGAATSIIMHVRFACVELAKKHMIPNDWKKWFHVRYNNSRGNAMVSNMYQLGCAICRRTQP